MIRSIFISLAFLLSLGGCSATAETPDMTTSASACDMRLDFSNESEVSQWRTVLDGVMGGKSSGNRFSESDHMVFRGVINTNGGGFSSIRRDMQPGDMTGAERLRLKVRQDDRDYKLTFRTSASNWGRSISYQLPIPSTSPGEWTDIEIALDGFDTSIFGRSVKAPAFDASDVREMGVIIADGIDGPFKIEIANIACSPAST